MAKIKVLYIDDEEHNLRAFRASFREDYTLFTALHPSLARDILDQHPDISVIFCDQRMPGETGSEFFSRILRTHPQPVRILITAYSDLNAVVNAINQGHIFRYVSKPWEELEIRSAIDEAHRFYQTTALLARSNEALNRAYQELDKFAYSATHDIRGPILSNLGLLQIARESESLEEVREMMAMMEGSMVKLDEYIQSLHQYYNLRRGELEIAPIDFEDLLKDQLSLYALSLRDKDIEVETQVEQKEGFRNDPVYMKMILNNLLSNAIKYQRSEETRKKIRIAIEVNRGQARIDVEDNGIGIAPEDQSLVYNLFYRTGQQDEGSGFGLYQTREAVERINGRLHLDSHLGVGSRFRVEIPSK